MKITDGLDLKLIRDESIKSVSKSMIMTDDGSILPSCPAFHLCGPRLESCLTSELHSGMGLPVPT